MLLAFSTDTSFWSVTASLAEGLLVTGELFLLTLLFALPLGLVICFASMSKIAPLRCLSKTLVGIIRGSPLMLQLIIIFYGPGLMFGLPAMPRFTATIVAFSINYACYFSEIYRGGIQSIPRGQYEAGQVLGLTRSQIFFKVTLLQLIKRIVPPMGNEFITLVKDISLARIIANKEIIMMAQEYASSKALIWPLFSTAVFFLVACGILTILLNVAEKKLDYFRM
jgi:polar amino acid transport system permease protein